MWGQFISLCRPRGCTPISLILFPVPLALRWYLRSLVFIIVCLSPWTNPSPLFRLPPSSVRWHSHSHTLARTRARTQTRLPRTLPPSWCCLIHFSTPSTHKLQLEAGGAGLDIYNQEQATSYTQTGPTCSAKTTSKKTPKPGVEVPTFILELRAKRQARPRRLVLRTVCWSSDTTNLSLRYTPVSLDIATKQSW